MTVALAEVPRQRRWRRPGARRLHLWRGSKRPCRARPPRGTDEIAEAAVTVANGEAEMGPVDICEVAVDAEFEEWFSGPSARQRVMDCLGHRREALLCGAFGGAPCKCEVLSGSAPDRRHDVVIARRAFSPAEVDMIHGVTRHPSVAKRVRHFVAPPYSARVERPLRALTPEVWERLLALMEWADGLVWGTLPTKAFPEAEYLVYEAPPEAAMGPHLDEDSALTAVAMLVPASAFVGGASSFGGDGSVGSTAVPTREAKLDLGDVLCFRGESLEHWVTPVTAGRRVVLQVELCRC
eukprot:gnl/TRDRNA2_/TRDRNA2_81863_c0_seq1.p1 gnl/TRDRNA2_/TRDRNA2_81863_c0~~gnl/TRDRNA2_/TRDRNA2_81863_c0_seq1.p1  ORF type:complete len:311 (-),score=39.68 gnl/TRDRNA2_/TRDRNA2_81863_c0_seq1:90-974(-)